MTTLIDRPKKITVKTAQPLSFLSLLTLLFIGLRLGGAIDWPWWQVLLPLWLPIAVIVLVVVFVVLVISLGSAIQTLIGGNRE